MSKLPELTPGIIRLSFMVPIIFVAVVLLLVLFVSSLFSVTTRDRSTPFKFSWTIGAAPHLAILRSL